MLSGASLSRAKEKRRHLKAMLCRGTNTLQSSSFLTAIKKETYLTALRTVTRAPSADWTTFLPQVWACSVCRQCPVAPAGSPQFVSLPEVSLACRMICCSISANPQRAATLKQTAACGFTKLRVPWDTGSKLVLGGGCILECFWMSWMSPQILHTKEQNNRRERN